MDIQFNFKTKYELKKFNDYVVMQASHNTDTIKIYCDKIDGGVIYLSFELPKKQKFVTLPLEYDSKKACYQYLLTSAQTQSVGHINFQLTLTLGQQVIKSNKIEGVIEVRESIVMNDENAVEKQSYIQEVNSMIGSLLQQVDAKMDAHSSTMSEIVNGIEGYVQECIQREIGKL